MKILLIHHISSEVIWNKVYALSKPEKLRFFFSICFYSGSLTYYLGIHWMLITCKHFEKPSYRFVTLGGSPLLIKESVKNHI